MIFDLLLAAYIIIGVGTLMFFISAVVSDPIDVGIVETSLIILAVSILWPISIGIVWGLRNRSR